MLGGLAADVPAGAQGAAATISIGSPVPAAQPSGSTFEFPITLSCQAATGQLCGPMATLTIPLSGSTVPPMNTWTYSATSSAPSLLGLSGATLTPQSDGRGGEQLVIVLADAVFVGGFSGTVNLAVTPPNHTTADQTTWSLDPTLSGAALGTATAPESATATTTSSLGPSVTVTTSGGAGSAAPGATVTYVVTPTCDANGALGDLWPTQGTLIDRLPTGATFESATNDGVDDAADGTVTWALTGTSNLPPGCTSGGAGPASQQVAVQLPAGATGAPFVDEADLTLQGPGGESAHASDSAFVSAAPGPSTLNSSSSSPPNPTTAGDVGATEDSPGAAGANTAATPTATLALSKGAFQSGTNTPLTTPVTPNGAYDYQLSAACSGLTDGCVGATTTDVLPPGIDFEGADTSPLYTVAFDSATRTVTVTYTSVLPAPPNPPGSVGIPAGSTRTAVLHVVLDPATTAPSGSSITNTATAQASNANPSSGSADITVSIPTAVTPVAAKTMTPTSLVAQSQARATANLSVTNASSGSASVTSLTVADTTASTWNTFNLTSVGPVESYPDGADEVRVGLCTSPVPCTPSEFVDGPFQTGSTLSLPAGTDPTTVTGIRFTFASRAGTPMPTSTNGGSVDVGLALRIADRTTGARIDPSTSLNQSNCATPSAVDAVAGTVTGTDACASYTIVSGVVGVNISKQLFADASASFAANGFPVSGQTPPSGVTGLTTAKNTSGFSVSNLTITDPSTTAPSNWTEVAPDALELVFPAGATTASGLVTCGDGSTIPISTTAPPTTVKLTPTCSPGSPATSVSVTYSGTIPPGATARLGVHGTLKPSAAGGEAVTDCSDGNIVGGTSGGASGTGCASLTVQDPQISVGGAKSSSSPSTGGDLVAGQTMGFTLQATNQGNLPVSSFEIDDPGNPPPTTNNPFSFLTVSAASVSVTPKTTPAPVFAIEVFNGTTWLPFSPAAAVGASGIRARLTSGLVAPNQSVVLSLTTQVSAAVPPGTTLTNCQITTVGQPQGTASTAPICAPSLVAEPPTTAGQIGKAIVPANVSAPLPGLTPTTQVRLRVANTGNLPLSEIVITDPDPTQNDPADFFDHADLVSLGAVNFPPGANRVQVDACLSAAACAAGNYTFGTPATTAALPSGVAPASVAGLRFTFVNSTGGFMLNPGSNFPTSGSCPSATVCFTVSPRSTLRSTGAPIGFPLSFSNVATAAGMSPISQGQLASFGSAPAPLTVAPGNPQLGVGKTASPRNVSPGTSISYSLATTNTGTAAIPGLTVTESIPSGLVFDPSFVGTGGQPYTVTATVPPGATPVPTPTFTISNNTLVWQFPETYLFEPTSVVTLGFQAKLTPGTAGGTSVTNTYGAGTIDPTTQPALTCAGGARPDPTLGCTASATVTAGSGSAVDAQKWVHGDDALGFFNTLTNTLVPIGDPSCPILAVGGDSYTRFPCIAEVLAGQDFSFVLQMTNVGTTPLTQTRLVDDLPQLGDQGVLVPGSRDTQWDPRPTLAGAPTIAGGQPGSLSTSFTDAAPGCLDDLTVPPGTCPAGSWSDTFSPSAEAFRGFLSFSPALPPAGTTTIVVPMSAPTDLNGGGQLPIAWNSFAHTDFFRKANGSTTQLKAVEPEKVGVAMPFGTLEIDKDVTGPIPEGSLIGPFTIGYQCVVTPTTGAPVTVAQGQVVVGANASAVVDHIPVGAVCTVDEPDSGGGIVTQPAPVTIVPDVSPDVPNHTVATVTNDFPAPGLLVTKAVAGGAADLVSGPFTIVVDCTIIGSEVAGYPRALTFDAAGSQELRDIPIGATCTVAEPDAHGATNATTAYVPDTGGSTVIGGTSVEAATETNDYDPTTLTVSKAVVGPGPAGPWSFTDACHLTGNTGVDIPVALPAADSQFSLSSGQSHTTTVPVGARCTATETGTPTGDTVTYDGSTSAPTLTVNEATTLAVTNTFAELPTPPPPATTTGAGTATGTGGTAASTGSAPAASGSPAPVTSGAVPATLAFTGTSLLGLVAGVALVVVGSALVLVGRRRRRQAEPR